MNLDRTCVECGGELAEDTELLWCDACDDSCPCCIDYGYDDEDIERDEEGTPL